MNSKFAAQLDRQQQFRRIDPHEQPFELGISIMTDPELHPLPITPNDPLSIFQTPLSRFSQSQQPFQQRMAAHSVHAISSQPEQANEILSGFNDLFISESPPPMTQDMTGCDIEISNTEDRPNSLFKSALPSLKLKIENKLSPDQEGILEKKRVEIQGSIDSIQNLTGHDSMLQGQGSSSKALNQIGSFLDSTSTQSPKKREVLDEMPDSVRQEISQNNLAQLKKQNSMISATDLHYQNILAINHQGMSNVSNSTYKSRYQCYSRFFIIKSFTEEDVHKAIKYNVWSSTQNGNQVLDEAYLELCKFKEQNNIGGGGHNNHNGQQEGGGEQVTDIIEEDVATSDADVYLMFSVNKSKHFCGVAKMVDRVRTDIRHDQLWKQSGKWPGSITVQWLFVKDIPNTQFIHIENPLNENKPVCQGRDCQEIFPRVGEKMLQIFANYKPLTRIYDDFMIYEEQEKVREERQRMKVKTVHREQVYGQKRSYGGGGQNTSFKHSLFSQSDSKMSGSFNHSQNHNKRDHLLTQEQPPLPHVVPSDLGLELDHHVQQQQLRGDNRSFQGQHLKKGRDVGHQGRFDQVNGGGGGENRRRGELWRGRRQQQEEQRGGPQQNKHPQHYNDHHQNRRFKVNGQHRQVNPFGGPTNQSQPPPHPDTNARRTTNQTHDKAAFRDKGELRNSENRVYFKKEQKVDCGVEVDTSNNASATKVKDGNDTFQQNIQIDKSRIWKSK